MTLNLAFASGVTFESGTLTTLGTVRSIGGTVPTGFIDSGGTIYPFKVVDGKPRISSTDYLLSIAEGDIPDHKAWSKIGYSGTLVAGVESELWSKGGPYTYPSSGGSFQVFSSGTADIGSVLFSGTSTGGGTQTLIDPAKNFPAGLTAAIGDWVILDKNGAGTPEWGIVTGVVNGTLTLNNGFSSGGVGSGRVYAVLDQSYSIGAQAVRVEFLNDSYVEKSEIFTLNGTAFVNSAGTNLFRCNSFRMICAGSNAKTIGNLTLQSVGAGTVLSYITAGFTRARNAQYTVPTNKTLYVNGFSVGAGFGGGTVNTLQYCRIYTKANQDNITGFNTGPIFYPYTEVLVPNGVIHVPINPPTKLNAKIDIKISAITSYAGVATIALRGWTE